MSETTFQRSFMAEPTEPSRPDLKFKHAYTRFCKAYREKHGWNFFLPLHPDDKYSLTALHLPSKDNQADFDVQLLGFTKILIDSLNEKQIAKGLSTIKSGDKGVTKLEKFLLSRGLQGFNGHIKFLRILQDLRSRSAAHRKGSTYDELVRKLRIKDEGQKVVFIQLLIAGQQLIEYLQVHLCSETPVSPVEEPSSKIKDVPQSKKPKTD